MKQLLIICLILIVNQSSVMGQFVLYLWKESLVLKKENIQWVEKSTFETVIEDGIKAEYLFSKIEISEDGKRNVTLFDRAGNIKEVNVGYFENEFLEVFETKDGDKEIKKYDENENLISETWMYPDGSKDELIFTYENNKLVKIVETDEFGTAMEELKYEDGKLSQIISIDEDGEEVMERKFLYDDEGKIEETQRFQDGEINKRVLYTYDENNRLMLKEERAINRLNGGIMPPEQYEYYYDDNGILKEEVWLIFKDQDREKLRYRSITEYNEYGLEIKEYAIDYKDKSEEITRYEYKMKE